MALFFIIYFIHGCVSQQLATKEEMTHEFILEYPSLSKDILFDRTLKWIANNFRSAKQVIEYQDKESGAIIGNGVVNITADGSIIGPFPVGFTMNIDLKDGKARYRFLNLNHNGNPIETYAWHKPARDKFVSIINSIKIAMDVNDEF